MAGLMARCFLLIAATGALAASSLHALGQVVTRPDARLEPLEFVLDDVRFRVLVPAGSRSDTDNPACVRIWHPRATRAMTFLELCSAARAAPDGFARRATLSNRARVRFSIDHDIGGGSGGTEGELKGVLELDGRTLALTCRDQGEGSNNPGWCLDYLQHLSVVGLR